MNVEQCRALGLIPYAVYGGRVESFKLRESQPQTYSDPVLLKVLDGLIEHRDHAVALAEDVVKLKAKNEALEELRPHWAKGYTSDSVAAQASTAALSQIWAFLGAKHQTEAMEKLRVLQTELDALKAQIAAGEPFDADEIEKIGNDLSEASKSALMSWTMVGDPRARHGLDKLLPPVTPKPGADLGRFDCAGDYVLNVPRDVIVKSLCDTCTLRDQPCLARVDQGPIVSCGMYDAKQELPRFENGGEWVEQLVGAIGPLFSKRCCNTCQREKSSCPFHVSGPMFGCASWVQRKEQN